MEGNVVVNLADGEQIRIADNELRLVYDDLWLRAQDIVGAVSTAGMIESARRGARVGLLREIALSDKQSGVFREALARIRESLSGGMA
jgi:hypothetical protein